MVGLKPPSLQITLPLLQALPTAYSDRLVCVLYVSDTEQLVNALDVMWYVLYILVTIWISIMNFYYLLHQQLWWSTDHGKTYVGNCEL